MMAIRHPGFSFQPTDEDLFFHYLLRRLNQEPCPIRTSFVIAAMYGGGDPWNIFDKDWDEKFYVFTMLKKKNKSRVDRTAGSGTWKGLQSPRNQGFARQASWLQKLFTFKPKAGSNAEADKAKNGHWIMYSTRHILTL
ncbi:hypothetical protein NL676_010182 [Syzygium grande]|nr:hypothetical protein NL676_010182 [Syzygium grande]